MHKVNINGSSYRFFGSVRGHLSNKWNRSTKLADRFIELDKKFRGIVERGVRGAKHNGATEHSRCALALLLMMHTGIRVGNEGSAEGYMTKPHPYSKEKPKFVQTYGLTTLLWEHIKLNRTSVELFFVGKKQVDNKFQLYDPQIVKWLRIMKDTHLSNQDQVFYISDYQLTKFIKRYVGRSFSPKDFRCMRANMYAWEFATTIDWAAIPTKGAFKKDLKAMYEFVASKLNNTPGVCRKSYVHEGLPDYLLELNNHFIW